MFSGVALMAWGGHWRYVWAWLSIVLFVAVFATMGVLGSGPITELRRAAGLPFVTRSGMSRPEWHDPQEYSAPGMAAAITALRPGLLSAVGLGGFAILTWLMLAKPF